MIASSQDQLYNSMTYLMTLLKIIKNTRQHYLYVEYWTGRQLIHSQPGKGEEDVVMLLLLLLFRKLMHSLGEAGEIEPETESILAEYDIDTDEYPPSVTEECIPNDSGQWNIPLVSQTCIINQFY